MTGQGMRMRAGAWIAAICATMVVSAAQADGRSGPQPGDARDRIPDITSGVLHNSEACGVSFYTEGADSLDLAPEARRTCIDLLAGDDLLVLSRRVRDRGHVIHTGPGRDRVFATDGADVIVDVDGRDEELRGFDGDDAFAIMSPAAREPDPSNGATPRGGDESDDGMEEVDAAPEGEESAPVGDDTNLRDATPAPREAVKIYPGAGDNRIRIGADTAFPMRARTVRLVQDDTARDRVSALCRDSRKARDDAVTRYGLRVMKTPPDASVEIASRDCGVALFSLRGRAGIDQTGGAFLVRADGGGQRLARLEAETRQTGAVFLDLADIDDRSRVDTSGDGTVVARMRPGHLGGVYRLSTTDALDLDISSDGFSADLEARGEATASVIWRQSGPSSGRAVIFAPRLNAIWAIGDRDPGEGPDLRADRIDLSVSLDPRILDAGCVVLHGISEGRVRGVPVRICASMPRPPDLDALASGALDGLEVRRAGSGARLGAVSISADRVGLTLLR